MINFKHICFDLDGTLVDSYQNIYKASVKTLQELKIEQSLYEIEFQKRIGHHFSDIFSDLKIPVKDIEEFINIYKGFYFDFINDSVLYDGVIDTLNKLAAAGVKISLLTTKGQDQADKIIDHFNLRNYFSFVMGRRIDLKIKPAAEPLIYICDALNISPDKTLMVGDSELDIECGKNAKAKTCAALYGYRSKEFLENLNPDYLISNIGKVLGII